MSPNTALVFAAALLAAGSARADAGAADLFAAVRSPIPKAGGAEAPAVRIRLPEPYAQAHALKSAGIAKTAIDRRLDGDEDVTGSLGFLCGLQPGARRTGAAAARGVDPSGRFLGAKLSVAFP